MRVPYAETCELALPALASPRGGAGGLALACASCTHAEPLSASTRAFELAKGGSSRTCGPGCPGRYRPGADPVGGFGRVPAKDRAARRRRACRRRGRAPACSLSRCYSPQSLATRTRPRALWTPSGRASATLVKRAGQTHGFWRRQPGRSAGVARRAFAAGATDALRAQPDFIARLEACLPRRATVTTTTTTRAPRTGLPWRRTCLNFGVRGCGGSERLGAGGECHRRDIAKWCSNDAVAAGALLRWFRRWTSPVARPTSSSPRDCTRTRWCSWPGRTRACGNRQGGSFIGVQRRRSFVATAAPRRHAGGKRKDGG